MSKVLDADGDQLRVGSVSKRLRTINCHELVHLVFAKDLVVEHVVAYLLCGRRKELEILMDKKFFVRACTCVRGLELEVKMQRKPLDLASVKVSLSTH